METGTTRTTNDTDPLVLADLGEDELLSRIFPLLGPATGALVGPGDDTALLPADGSVLATTDAMVRGSDWLDAWSSGVDVGIKAVAQNAADIAAMGGVTTGLLVTLAAAPDTTLAWVLDLTRGLSEGAATAGAPIVGGDLSGAPAGVVMVSITALGSTQGRPPVLRSTARPGDVVAVAGTLGRSHAGWALLREDRERDDPDLVAVHRRPAPPLDQGPAAALAGATAMIDLSDGLLRDAGRVGRASGVVLRLDRALLAPDAERIGAVLDADQSWECVLTGGEEHSLLACFPADVPLPAGWRRIGDVVPAGSEGAGAAGAEVDGVQPGRAGWDHFGG